MFTLDVNVVCTSGEHTQRETESTLSAINCASVEVKHVKSSNAVAANPRFLVL